MALLVGDLVAVMDVEDAGFNRKLDDGHSKFGAVAGAMGRGIATIATVTGAALVAGGSLGIRTAAQLEQAEIGFTTMLGSGEKAKAFLAELQAFAASTPFELPQLQTAASSLMSVGVEANRVIPIMTVLGDATAAMGTGGEGVERATRALQQMVIKGKVSGEEMLQLAEAGVPAWEALATSLGVTTAKAQDMVTKGKVSAEDLFQALESRSGATMQRISGMMSVQSQSMTGLWNTLKDTVSVGLATAIQPLVPLIKDQLGNAIQFASDMTPKLAAGLQSVVTWATTLIDKLQAGDMSALPAPIRSLVDVVNEFRSGGGGAAMSTDLGSIKDSARELGPAVRELAASMPSLNDVVSVSSTVFGFLADHIDLLDDLLPYLVAGFVLVKTAQAVGNVVALASLPIQAAQVASNFRLAAALRLTAASSSSSAATQVAASGAVTASSMRTAAATSVAQLKIVGGWIMMGVQSMLNAARMAAAWIIAMGPIGWVIAGVVALVALIIANWDAVKRGTEIVWQAVWGFIKQAADSIVGIFLNWTLPGLIFKHWDSIKAGATTVWEAVTGFIGSIPGRIVSFFLNWTLPGLIIKHWDAIRSGAVDKFNDVVGFIAAVPGRILGALGNVGSLLLESGKDIVRGLWDGLNSMSSWLASKVIDMVTRTIPAPIRSALGISSPSLVAAEIARWVPAGMAKGLTATAGLAVRAARSLAVQVSSALQVGAPGGPRFPGGSGGAAFAGAGGAGGTHVGQVVVKAYGDRFSLGQVMDDLKYRGAH